MFAQSFLASDGKGCAACQLPWRSKFELIAKKTGTGSGAETSRRGQWVAGERVRNGRSGARSATADARRRRRPKVRSPRLDIIVIDQISEQLPN